MAHKCFLVKPTDRAKIFLRRYASSDECSGPMGYHDAMVPMGELPITFDECGYWSPARKLNVPREDARWPRSCECGYEFQPEDNWQESDDRIWASDEAEWGYRDLPVGAMYFENWMPPNMFWDNQSGPHLHVITPGGTWNIDSRASNCTKPNDRIHRCWVRHGEAPAVNVDKAGLTCAAGAGSIMCGNYHGFLRNGSLT